LSITVDTAGYMDVIHAATSLAMTSKRLGELRRRRPGLFPNLTLVGERVFKYHADDVRTARATLRREKESRPLRGM
jgi:hypothetical protein